MSTYTLTQEQDDAVEDAVAYVLDDPKGKRHHSITGLAGTGKTVVAMTLVNRLKEMGKRPVVCAPTGKAANVLTSKSDNTFVARTLHSVVTVDPKDNELAVLRMIEEELAKKPKPDEKEIERLEEIMRTISTQGRPLTFEPCDPHLFYSMYDCMVIDEASMVGKNELHDPFIQDLAVPKIYFGDYGQLQPVKDRPAIELAKADTKLDKIHRQAADSPIIKLAHGIREKRPGDISLFEMFFDNDELKPVTSTSISALKPYIDEGYQFLCFSNKNRSMLNSVLRVERGIFDFEKHSELEAADNFRQFFPVVGETLLLDQNIRDKGLYKSAEMKVVSIEPFEKYLKRNNPYQMHMKLEPTHSAAETVEGLVSLVDLVPADMIVNVNNPKRDYIMRQDARKRSLLVNYPYCLTVHKAQGSEWPKVLLYADNWVSNSEFREWFYTAVTRASETLAVASDTWFREILKAKGLAPKPKNNWRKRLAARDGKEA